MISDFRKMNKAAVVLWLTLILFIGRVLGQLAVVLYAPSFLPPMKEWYSGLMPYPYLLLSQILIIILFMKICLDITKGTGFFAQPNRKLGLGLRNFGIVYFIAMVIRYILRMSWYPEERWFGGTIPIIFHWVLATFIITLGLYHVNRSKS